MAPALSDILREMSKHANEIEVLYLNRKKGECM